MTLSKNTFAGQLVRAFAFLAAMGIQFSSLSAFAQDSAPSEEIVFDSSIPKDVQKEFSKTVKECAQLGAAAPGLATFASLTTMFRSLGPLGEIIGITGALPVFMVTAIPGAFVGGSFGAIAHLTKLRNQCKQILDDPFRF